MQETTPLLSSLLLFAIAATFLLFAVWTWFKPHSLSQFIGYGKLSGDGFNEFMAIYAGVFTAKAGIACWAAMTQSDELHLAVAALLLSQPMARVLSYLHGHACQGKMKALGWLEALSGSALIFLWLS